MPVKLDGEGQYNINELKEIKVTESYLGLEQHVKGCQNNEPIQNCSTRTYIDTLFKECGCLPFNVRLSEKVCCMHIINSEYKFFY